MKLKNFLIFVIAISVMNCGKEKTTTDDKEAKTNERKTNSKILQSVEIGKLSFVPLSKPFVSGGSFTEAEIFANLQGKKSGYSLKEIKDISDPSVASLSADQKSINFLKVGTFTATLIFEHNSKKDVTFKNIQFSIRNFSFSKLTKIHNPIVGFSGHEILGAVNEIKEDWTFGWDKTERDGWKIKKIQDISDTSVAKISRDQKSILPKLKSGAFTATVVLKKDGVSDVTISNAQFETYLVFAGLNKVWKSGGSFTESEIVNKMIGADFSDPNSGSSSAPSYKLKEIKDISDNSVANLSADRKNINFRKVGTFTATLVFEYKGQEFPIPNAQFEIMQQTKWEKGYANTSEFFFYYPKDHKIYFASTGNSIYRMDVDGLNVQKIHKNIATTVSNTNVYVHQDWIYYNHYFDKKIYKVKTDGTSHSEFIDDGYRDMRVYGNYFYYLNKNVDLMRIPLDKSTEAEAVVKSCGCSGEEDNFHVKGNQVYHSSAHYLSKTDLTTKKTTVLSQGQNDAYIFTENYIYFRNHAPFTRYGIVRSNYDLFNSSRTEVSETMYEMGTDGINFNLSASFFTYINRSMSSGTKKTDEKSLYYVALNGKVEAVLQSNVNKRGSYFDPPQVEGNLKILGDWVYYLQEVDNYRNLEIYRIKKDGTQLALVHRLHTVKDW